VYSECQQSGGGGKPTSSSSSPSGTQHSTSVTHYVSKPTAKALKNAGADGKVISNLVTGYGVTPRLLQSHLSAAHEPTAVGSAFDLGSGPTLLLIVLGGAAVLLFAAVGFRGMRR